MNLPKIDLSIFPETQIKENIKFNVNGLKEWGETLVSDPAKALRWFWKGKELGTEMRLGDLYEDKTGLYKHSIYRPPVGRLSVRGVPPVRCEGQGLF